MTSQAENALERYRKQLEKALEVAPRTVKDEAIEDANEFLADEVRSMDVGRLSSADAAYQRLVERFGTPQHLASTYVEQSAAPALRNRSRIGRRLAVVLIPLALLCCGVAYAFLREPPKVSPFTDVRFVDDDVLVIFEGTEYEWLELDNLEVPDIVQASQEQHGSRWKKRVAEDLVEVLWGMGHSPGGNVSLRLLDPATRQERVVESTAMSNENRDEVWLNASKREEELAKKVLADPIGFFYEQLKARWAYYLISADEIEQSVIELRDRFNTNASEVDLALEFQKLIALGIDGHASVSDWRLEGRNLPFLIEPVDDRFVAFQASREDFVDPEHPYITAIDGVKMVDWIDNASELVAKGSTQLVRRRSARLLRHIDYWRLQKGLEVRPQLSVTLASVDGKSTVIRDVSTINQKPIYGDWPRTKSELLDNNIGYLRLPRMNDEAVDEIKSQMRTFADTEGLVVDVRGNGGGSRKALRVLSSYLLSPNAPPRVANVAKYRKFDDFPPNHLDKRFMYRADSDHWSDEERRAIAEFASIFQPAWEPPADKFSRWHYMVISRLADTGIYHYEKPVVILSDAGCFSATDIFLGAFKGLPNVTLVGTPSSGGSARSESFRMAGTSIRIGLASMSSFQPDGRLYDGNGIEPDEWCSPSAKFFIGEEDPVLVKAIELLLAAKS